MRNIIRTSMMAAIAVLISASLSAQDRNHRISREELAVKQAEHICEALAFDKPTADRFKETYCSYQKELWALGPVKGKQDGDAGKEDIEQRFERSQKILNLRKKYYGIYSTFLTQKQITRVYEIERNMMQKLAAHNGRTSKPAKSRRR